MNYIESKADDFAYRQIILDQNFPELKTELFEVFDLITNELDRVQFMKILFDTNSREYQNHYKECTNKKGCDKNMFHEDVKYLLTQQLDKITHFSSDNVFTEQEMRKHEELLDEIKAKIEKLLMGQQIIYDDLDEKLDAMKAEIDELKRLYTIGKKNWYQLLGAKLFEMFTAGLISETVVKEILRRFDYTAVYKQLELMISSS